MPYKSMDEINPSLKGIKPRITLEQANEIARIADAIAVNNPGGAWAISIAQFKRINMVRNGRWVKRKPKGQQREVAEEIYPDDGDGRHRTITIPGVPIEFPEGVHVYGGEESPLWSTTGISEAATYKTKCQALIRDMAAIMQDRTLPPKMRESLGHIQAELKRTWADLAMGAQMENDIMAKPNLAEVMKTVDGVEYPASDFLVVENPDEPSTWHLQVKKNGTPDHRLMGAAKAALTSPGGHRGNVYEGTGKQAAIAKLKSLYKSEDLTFEERIKENGMMDMPMDTPSMAMPVGYGATSFADLDAAYNAQEAASEASKRVYQFQMLVSNALGDETITDKVAAIKKIADEFVALIGELFADPTQPPPMESEIEDKPKEGESTLAESAAGSIVQLAEQSQADSNSIVPLALNVRLIKPGWGNKEDMNYYPADVLQRDANVFVGLKMYETDHRDGEKSTRTWVSTVDKIVDYQEGAPIARVIVHDPNFAERIKALDTAKMLDKMECSILGYGKSHKGKAPDGIAGNIVESFTRGKSVDWVTRAGAGGAALNISENEKGGNLDTNTMNTASQSAGNTTIPVATTPIQETQTPPSAPVAPAVPVLLSEADVKKQLAETHLPAISQERLLRETYADDKALRESIEAEIEYVKKLTGSGSPFGQGATTATLQKISEADHQKALDEIDRKYGLRS